MTEARETVKCRSCALVQFQTKDDLCRKCKEPLTPPKIEAPVVELNLFPPVEVTIGDMERAIALVLRALRGTRSQNEIARKISIPRTYLTKCEHGRIVPTLSSMERFAKAYDMPLWKLIHEIETARDLLAVARQRSAA